MNSTHLKADDFSTFFRELWGADCDPFPWQREFARRLCVGQAPDFVAVPTGSGKTACLDATVFALAVQTSMPMAERTQGRRIFFIVNRRVIVDEAYERAGRLCEKLKIASPESVVGRVASALLTLSGESNGAPLTRAQLRGGIYRDRSWASSLVHPMIICSTVDQAGSRLLFRGYGVSPQARPIHAALFAHDSLLIIDEAHISRPFIQTLQWVEKYRRHQPAGTETVRLPFQFLQMTATPPAETRDEQKIALSQADREHPILKPRLDCPKPAQLVIEPKAKGKVRDEQMAKRLVDEAGKILAENPPRSIAIMVNRVSTARSVTEKMKKAGKGRVSLLIGRLRPVDREVVTKDIKDRLKTGADVSATEDGPLIVVSTQCLEVGADLDFDALVTEAASLDALRQRFGRLNRGGRDIVVRAVIVLPGDQDLPAGKLDDAAPCDPIYNNAIPRTWEWLNSISKDGMVDFGINAMSAAVDDLRAKNDEALAALLSPTENAPVLLPAYLDCWAQTNPAPAVEPDVALFLHGPQRDMTEVQICWRGDLPDTSDKAEWADILSLCPPTAAECLPVPLHVFRDWLNSRGKFEDPSGDVAEGAHVGEKKESEEARSIDALVWRGPDEVFWAQADALRPSDTIVLRVQSGAWESLGHLPSAPSDPQNASKRTLSYDEVRRVDVAEQAVAITRRRAIFRVHSAFWSEPEAGSPAATLFDLAKNPETEWRVSEMKGLLKGLLSDERSAWALTSDQRRTLEHLVAKGGHISVERYPNNRGFVFASRDLLSVADNQTSDTDSDALLESTQSQELWSHTNDVLAHLEDALALLPLARWREALLAAATLHDWGKTDPRFQALLRGTTPFAVMASESFLAKSVSIPACAAARLAARERAELPGGFRHEMLSMQMALTSAGKAFIPVDTLPAIATLHLIASHHGYARPFAPVVTDESPPNIHVTTKHGIVSVDGMERSSLPPHRIDSGIADRFWELTRVLGWWGLPYLEAVLRLADQRASEIASSRHSTSPIAAIAPL